MKTHIFILLVAISTVSIAQNSILFDASDQQYLTISNADDRFNATADFTYEIWVKFTSKGFDGKRLAPFFGGQQHDYAALLDNKIGMRLNSNSVCSGDRMFGSTSTIETNTWYHIAYVRSGSIVSLFLDGTLLGTTECAQEDGSVKGVWMINANTINIGAIFWNTSYLDGYIGGMRYVVGSALYSEDFTPQLRWEKTNETILLMNIKNEGAAFTDESDYSNTINLNGSSSAPTFVAENGPTFPADILMSGDVSIENNSIKNVADPVYAQDAATKNYVDTNTSNTYTKSEVDALIANLQQQIDEPVYTIGYNAELGGYVFMISADGKHGLVAETEDQGLETWYDAQNLISNPSNHSTVGQNFTDWRLPTRYELAQMYILKTEIESAGGDSFGTKTYWTSNQSIFSINGLEEETAWRQNFGNGAQYSTNAVRLDEDLFVRSVREF
jgi:hypothetical protein